LAFYWYKHGVATSPAHRVVEGWRDQVLDPRSRTLMAVEWRHWTQSEIDILYINKQPKISEDVTRWEAIILNLKLAIRREEQEFKQRGVPRGSSASERLTLDSKKAEMEGMDSDAGKDLDDEDADGETDDPEQKWGDEGGGVVDDESEPEQDIKTVKRMRQDSNEGAESRAVKRKRGVSGDSPGDNHVSVKKQALGGGGSSKQRMAHSGDSPGDNHVSVKKQALGGGGSSKQCMAHKLTFREALIKKRKVSTKSMS
jgi:hypothetical protein